MGLLFGAIGFGFFLYGNKQKAVVPLITGIVPYLIANVYVLVMVGVILTAIPFFVQI